MVLVCYFGVGRGGGGNHHHCNRAAARIVGLAPLLDVRCACNDRGSGGFLARRSRVIIGYAPFLGQLLTMVVRTAGGSMLPLGIIFSGFIGLSGVAAAFAGAFLGKRVLGETG